MKIYVLKFGKNYYSSSHSDSRGNHVRLNKDIQESEWLTKERAEKLSKEIGGVITKVDMTFEECE